MFLIQIFVVRVLSMSDDFVLVVSINIVSVMTIKLLAYQYRMLAFRCIGAIYIYISFIRKIQ